MVTVEGSILWVRCAVARRMLASLDPSAVAEHGPSRDTKRTYVADSSLETRRSPKECRS
jgi:hypothetical protein